MLHDSNFNRDFDVDGPTQVSVNMYVRAIEKFCPTKGELSLQLTFRQEWNDPRLAYAAQSQKLSYINLRDMKSIWIPDSFFSDSLRGHKFDLLSDNTLLRIKPDGHVLYSQRVAVTVRCPSDLSRYPFDNQVCTLRLASYGYTEND